MDVRATASLSAFGRVGFVVPRYKHSAVDRNRLKRRLRELVRLQVLTTLPPLDVVIRVFPSAYQRTVEQLQADLLQAMRRLVREVS
jgi:ribonuclease P protein component